jgi:hypothetical protein
MLQEAAKVAVIAATIISSANTESLLSGIAAGKDQTEGMGSLMFVKPEAAARPYQQPLTP